MGTKRQGAAGSHRRVDGWRAARAVLFIAVLALFVSLAPPRQARAATAGLVAAYGFDAGSGTAVADQSGNGNNGTVANTTWAATGKYGSALQFNGTSSLVTVPDAASLHLTTAMTLEAWVDPSTVNGNWRDVIYKANDNFYLEATSSNASKPDAGLIAGGSYGDAYGTAALPANSWSYLAETYDGATLRLYVNGTQVASTAHTGAISTSTNPLQIGGDSLYGQYFAGMIDEVRIYNTALTATQIQTDQTTPITPSGPTYSVGGSVSGLSGSVVLQDNGGDALSVSANGPFVFATSLASGAAYAVTVKTNPSGQTCSVSNGSGTVGSANVTNVAVSCTTVPTYSIGGSVSGLSGSVVLQDNGGDDLTVSASGPFTFATQLAGGAAYSVTVKTNPSGQTCTVSGGSGTVGSANVTNVAVTCAAATGPSGLVAAYGFDAGSGTAVADQSGNGNNGTVANTTWAATGKYGSALQFNGTSSLVTVPDAASLHLTTAMTLEAWVDPSTVNGNWRDVIYKANDNFYLEATSSNGSKPDAGLIAGGSYGDAYGTAALPANSWSYLAETYDGATLRLYVNGTQVASTAHTGAISTSTNPLQIGGDSLYGQYFAGMIDEVRIYNTALTATQIQTDQTTPITPSGPDTQPPTQPGTLSANAVSAGEVDLSWGASTDNVAVTGYLIERCLTASCTFTQIGTTGGTTTTYKDTTVAASTGYSYRVRATDAVPNLSPYSNTATATTPAATGPAGLVAAYGFDAGSGTAVADQSGNGNNGTAANTTWAATGKYGSALQFNGTSSLVTVPDAASLHLTTAMTLEAWVDPSTVNGNWRDVIYKANDNFYLEATSSNASKPDAGLIAGGSYADAYGTAALPANSWSYLAETYDGTTLRLYVNGTQVASTAHTGAISTSTNPLQIGGDSLYGQYFAGMIDEVRIYNTALTATQIQTDQTTPITPSGPDTQPPTQPGTLSANAVSAGEVDLSWGASTDNVAVTGYLIERCLTASCTFTQIGTTGGTTTTYKDTTVAASTGYSYRVRATDAVPNLSPYSNTATTTTPTAAFTVSPNNAVLTFTRTQQYTAQGAGSVTWLVDGVAGGNSSSGTITSGGLYTPPSTVGSHTISAATGTATAIATVYVSNYAGTFTFHNDNMRDGENLNETVLTPSNVNSTTFGKLFSYPLDGLTFASPLYAPNVNIPGQGFHNLVIVATEHDSVYAFDADGRSNTPIWKDSFINPATGVTPIPPADTGETGDIPNEIGITGTPVIDPTTNTIYLVAATKEVTGGTTKYVNRLHALDLTTGAEKFGGPIVITASVPGNGVDAQGGVISFNNITENQRAALTLQNGELYVAFANHGFNPPYHGWVMAYNPSTLHQDWVFCTTPNAQSGGVWMGGDGIAADSSGNLFFSTGNGTFDGPPSRSGGKNDFGDTLLKLNANGTEADYFTPYNYAALDSGDVDLASGGIILLPDQAGPHPHEVIAAGKGGTVYLVDRDKMGSVGSGSDNQIVQSLINVFPTGGSYNTGNYSAPTYFNGSVYYVPVDGPVMAFSLTNGLLSTSPTSQSSEIYNGKTSTFSARGGESAISANGSSDGILWALQSNGDSSPGTLHAYDPSNLSHEYYTSDQAGTRDQLDPWLKFTIPLVANGRVYVVSAGQLTAYGLLP